MTGKEMKEGRYYLMKFKSGTEITVLCTSPHPSIRVLVYTRNKKKVMTSGSLMTGNVDTTEITYEEAKTGYVGKPTNQLFKNALEQTYES